MKTGRNTKQYKQTYRGSKCWDVKQSFKITMLNMLKKLKPILKSSKKKWKLKNNTADF